MKNKSMKKRGFTLIEMVLVLAIMSILAGVGVILFTSVINSSNEKVCHVQCQGAVQLYKAYAANGGEFDIDNFTGTKFLVKSGFLSEEYQCPNGGVYTWKVDKIGNVSVSCSIHGKTLEKPFPEKTIIPYERNLEIVDGALELKKGHQIND